MDFESIMAILIAAAPSLTAVIGCVSSYLKTKANNKITNDKILEEFSTVREEVMKTKEYETLKAELLIAHQENRELKKLIKELLTKIDKVARDEEE